MRRNPDPLLEPLSHNDLGVLGRIVPVLVVLMLVFIGRATWRGTPLVDIDSTETRPAKFRMDVNSAGWPEIAQLPGIGEVLAQRIVQYREEHGPFKRIEDLTAVHGVGEKLLDRGRRFLLPIPQEDIENMEVVEVVDDEDN